jgi:hypothetical protein
VPIVYPRGKRSKVVKPPGNGARSDFRQIQRALPGKIEGMAKHNFKISGLSPEFVESVRNSRTDESGNRLRPRRDRDRHQCRSCLRLTAPGEAYLALSYRPFSTRQAFAESGPIYIHSRRCEPYRQTTRYPREFPREEVVLRAYTSSDEIADARFVGPRKVEDVIRELFQDERNRYLHARNSTYGCFMFRIDRAPART